MLCERAGAYAAARCAVQGRDVLDVNVECWEYILELRERGGGLCGVFVRKL